MPDDDSAVFEMDLQRRAKDLMPRAMELLGKLAEGNPCGTTYRVRPSTVLSSIKLILMLARGEPLGPVTESDMVRLESIDNDSDDHVDAEAFEKILWTHAPELACIPRYLDTTEEDFDDMSDGDQEKTIKILQPLQPHLENPESLLNFFKMTRKQKVDLILHIGKKIVQDRATLEEYPT